MRLRLLIAFGAILLFVPTLGLRKNTYGAVTALEGHDASWRSLTNLGLLFTTAWYQEGPWNLGFILQMNPSSVEFGDRRTAYASYPPTFVIPAYVGSLISGKPPTLELLMNLSLFAHLFVAVTLALLALGLLEDDGAPSVVAGLGGLVAAALVLYLPSPLMFFQNVWWPDLAGLPFYVSVLFLERTRRYPKLQMVLLFLGCLTDWLNFVLAMFLAGKRALRREDRPSTAAIGSVVLSSLLLIALFELRHSSFSALWSKLLQRTGATGEYGSAWELFFLGFWGQTFKNFYGIAGLALLGGLCLVAFAYLYRRRARAEEASSSFDLLFLAVTPMVTHAFFLRNHYVHHTYNTFKFAIPLALLPPVLFRLLRQFSRFRLLPPVAAIGIPLVYLADQYPQYRALNAVNQNLPASDVEYAAFLRKYTGFSDVIFTSDQALEPADPTYRVRSELVALTNKNIWRATDISQIRDFLRKALWRSVTPAACNVAVIGSLSNVRQFRYWKSFAAQKEALSENGLFYLVRIDPQHYRTGI